MHWIHLPLVLVIAVAACSKDAPASKTPSIADPVPMGEASQPTEAPSTSGRAVLAAYERARASLAADDLTGVPEAARELETSAKAAAIGSSGEHFAAIAAAAPNLAAATDLKAARASFGQISQHLVAVLAADKTLATGQHVFECPMAAGYKKWVQPSKDLENPYMGKRMLTCGGPSTLE